MEKEKELKEKKSGGIHKFERGQWSEFQGIGNSSQSKHTRCVLGVLPLPHQAGTLTLQRSI